jgi:acetyl esterase/lipase
MGRRHGGYAGAVETVVYKRAAGCEIALDVYPAAATAGPVVVWIHGGALIMGTRARMQPALRAALAEAGCAQVSIDYRLAPETKLPDIFADVQDALGWVRGAGAAQFGWDPARVGVVGHSAGGYLTSMVGAHVRPSPRALVSFYGYGDVGAGWYAEPDPFYCTFPTVDEAAARSVVGVAPLTTGSSERHPFYLWCRQNGQWPREVVGFGPDGEAFRRFCPEHLVTGDHPPTLLLHGTADTDVPYEQSALMAAALRRAGVPHELVTVEGGPHGFDRDVEADALRSATSPAAAAVARAATFLRERL